MSPVFWAIPFVAIVGGAALFLSAAPSLMERRRVKRQLDALARHPAASDGGSVEADLLRPAPGTRRWAFITDRIPRFANNEKLLRHAGVMWTPERYMTIRFATGFFFGVTAFLIVRNIFAFLIAFSIGFGLPAVQVRRKKAKRIASFEDQLPGAIELISRAVRAGHPLIQGLKLAGYDSPEPLATEFRIAYEENRFGMPLDETLLRLGERLDLADARMLITAILVQRDAGGNIAEVFERLAQVMRERVVLTRQVRIHTAQGRMSGYILSALPIAIGLLLLVINPGYVKLLVDDPIGRIMLSIAAVMQIIGHFWIQRVVRIDV